MFDPFVNIDTDSPASYNAAGYRSEMLLQTATWAQGS